MADNIATFPDIEALLVNNLDVGVDVLQEVPESLPDLWVRVERIGGTKVNMILDKPNVVIEAWGVNRDAAYALLTTARGAAHDLAGSTLDGFPVKRVNEIGGVTNLPDDKSGSYRYTVTLEILVRGK